MLTAVGRANTMGAKYVSMSWGGAETQRRADVRRGVLQPPRRRLHRGLRRQRLRRGGSYPASSNRVVAVGGTSLTRGDQRPRLDRDAPGPAPAAAARPYEAKPAGRPATPAAATRARHRHLGRRRPGHRRRASTTPTGGTGWSVYGGTSASAPIIAAAYALAGPQPAVTPAQMLYAHPSQLNDVTTGSNGSCTPGRPVPRRRRLGRPDRSRHSPRASTAFTATRRHDAQRRRPVATTPSARRSGGHQRGGARPGGDLGLPAMRQTAGHVRAGFGAVDPGSSGRDQPAGH